MMVLLAAFAASTAFAIQGTPKQLPMDPSVRKGKLANGMTYYIRHNEKPKGQADFYIWHDVGSIQENDDQQGLAHFLEHMAFNGTKNLPGKTMIEYLEKIGVKFGNDLNAYTTWDRTVYNINNVPTKRQGCIDTALLILHDWSHFLSLEASEIDAERGVIMEELRTRDNAQWRSQYKMIQALTRGTRYEERNLIGYLDYLKTFEHRVLRDFYQQWYRPEYQAIVIAGDIDVDKVEAQIKKLMKDIAPSKKNASKKETIIVPDNKEPIVSIYTDPEMQSTSARVIIKHPARPEIWNNTVEGMREDQINVFFSLMANNRMQEIAMQPNAPFLQAGFSTGGVGLCPTLSGTTVYVGTPDGELMRGFEAVYAEMERIRRFGFTEGELQRVKKDMTSWLDAAYANSKNRTNDELVQECLNNYDNNSSLMASEEEEVIMRKLIAEISLEEVNKHIADLISSENQVIIVNAPEKQDLANPTEQEILAAREKAMNAELTPYVDSTVDAPLLDPSIRLNGSPVQTTSQDQLMGTTEWILKNGIKIIVKPTTFKADELRMYGFAKGGLALLPAEEHHMGELLTTFTSMSGIGQFNAQDLSKQLAGKNAGVSPGVSNYECSMNGNCALKDMETMFQLLYLHFTQPRFGENEYNIAMNMIRTQLANIKTNPDYLMNEARSAALYNNNPLRQELTLEDLDKFDFKKLPSIYKKLFPGANGYTFVFVGNVDLDALKPMVEKYIGSLPTDNEKIEKVDDNVRITRGHVEKEFRCSMQQPKVSVFYNYLGDSDASIKESLAARFLGEALNSRYLISIREEKGGTYSVGVSGMVQNTPEKIYRLVIMFDTNEAMADELMEIIVKEIENIAKNGPVVEDIENHRKFLLKSWENSLENNGAWINYITVKETLGLNYVADYEKAIRELTPADVQAMAKRVLKDKNLIHVVMRPEAK